MRIAIIGFGVVGKSVLSFLTNFNTSMVFNNLFRAPKGNSIDLLVWDKREFTPDEIAAIDAVGARSISGDTMTIGEIVMISDWVIVGPGVNMNRYKQYAHKILCELDFFSYFVRRPTVGITGSLGKTTTTKLLGLIAEKIFAVDSTNKLQRIAVGGNIGLGMLDLLYQQEDVATIVLELSSFQLEFNKGWAPDIAIWTNCFANHLDRHETMAAYIEAKLNILRYQSERQVAFLSSSLIFGECKKKILLALSALKSKLYVVCVDPNERERCFKTNLNIAGFVTIVDEKIIINQVNNGLITKTHFVCSLTNLPLVTFVDNWLHILGALFAMGIEENILEKWMSKNRDAICIENEHRCEFVASIRGVDFYNDSKATVIQSTEAAVGRFASSGRPIILILGGLSKGVDRSPLINQLANIKNIKKIYCFGKECAVFSQISSYCTTLEGVIEDIEKIMVAGDLVLLSPSGTSYDLYKNYEERGTVFKMLVKNLCSH